MKRLLLVWLAAAACTRSGTGVEVTVTGPGLQPDTLEVVAHLPGRDLSRTVAVPAGVGLPTTFLATLADATATVRFDVTAKQGGATLAAGSSPDVTVPAHHVVATTVPLGGGADALVPPDADLGLPWVVAHGGPPLGTGAVTAVWGSAATDVYATVAGDPQHNLLRSIDRGATWSAQNVGGGGDLDAVWGASAGDIYLVGAGGRVFHGAGTSWTPDTTTALNGATLYAVFGLSGSDVYVAGANDVVAHRASGSWLVQTANGTTELHGLGGAAGELWAVGSGGTILHSTGGGSWSPVTSGVGVTLRGVFATAANDVWIVGDGGTVLHAGGGAFAPAADGIDAGRDLFAIAGGGGALFAAGARFSVYRRSGSAWQPDPTGVPVDDPLGDTLYALFVVSPSELFAGGNGQTILHRE